MNKHIIPENRLLLSLRKHKRLTLLFDYHPNFLETNCTSST